MRILTEIEQKEICKCEDDKCNFYPLKHLQKCPICNSEAWHQIVRVLQEPRNE